MNKVTPDIRLDSRIKREPPQIPPILPEQQLYLTALNNNDSMGMDGEGDAIELQLEQQRKSN